MLISVTITKGLRLHQYIYLYKKRDTHKHDTNKTTQKAEQKYLYIQSAS